MAMNAPFSPNMEVPPHVPPHLVRDFRTELLPGVEADSIRAVVDATRGGPDIFFGLTTRRGASWIITRHELMREVYQDAATFSSRHNGDFSAMIGENWPLLPLEADPPNHANWRMLLNPIFSPTRMKALEAQIELLSNELVDAVLARGEADFMADFAGVFPIQIFLRLFGLPIEDTAKFLGWEKEIVHSMTLEGRERGLRSTIGYLRDVIAERRVQPTDDLISYIAGAQIEGRPLTDDEAVGFAVLLYVAGLDTVASTLGFMFKHLAEHPNDQQLLRDDSSLIPNAIEELLRAYPIVLSGRMVTRDVDFHGVQMKAGDVVTLVTPLAGRDDREFEDPDKIDLRRENVSHITFAAGPHRCVGSHLARRELRIALTTWLNRVPPFRIKPGDKAVTHGISQFGVVCLPLVWDEA
jgi:cytochrome P450